MSSLGSYNPSNGAINFFALQSGGGPGEGLAVDANNNVWVSSLYAKQLAELPAGTGPTPTPSVGGGSPSPTVSPTITPTGTPPPNMQPGPVFKTWYFAEGRAGDGFKEWLSLDNPTSNACQVYTFTMNVLGHSRATADIVAIMLQHLCPSGSPTPCFEVSMTVQTINNGGAFVTERPMYFNVAGEQGGTDTIGYIGS